MLHVPILLNTVINYWQNTKNGVFFDCTFGQGGHTKALLSVLNQNAQVYGLDVDPWAIEVGQELARTDKRFQMIDANFRNLKLVCEQYQIPKISGILFDFGVSSPQLDRAERGFSYHLDSQLDMRLNPRQQLTAKSVIANASIRELTQIFQKYGESKYAYPVACKIVHTRQNTPITTTLKLVEVIKSALPTHVCMQKKHPARVFFQALRIHVNQELHSIELMLQDLNQLVDRGGVVVFLTFHSLEERLVKRWIFEHATAPNIPSLPVRLNAEFQLLTKKPIVADDSEISTNVRARSAKLWALRKN